MILNGWRLKVPLRWTMQLPRPALPAAYALGRVGCFLVNDDYGRPTDLPWALKFPQGLPPSTAASMEQLFGIPVSPGTDPSTVLAVHPTQIYEAIIMLAAFMLMWSLRKAGPVGWIFGLYLAIAGVERFLIEILRAKDDRFLGPFTLAQLTSVCWWGRIWSGKAPAGRRPRPGPLSSNWSEALIVKFFDSYVTRCVIEVGLPCLVTVNIGRNRPNSSDRTEVNRYICKDLPPCNRLASHLPIGGREAERLQPEGGRSKKGEESTSAHFVYSGGDLPLLYPNGPPTSAGRLFWSSRLD